MSLVDDIEWRTSGGLIAYTDALAEMDKRNIAIQSGDMSELIWLLEHPPLYTAGTSADPSELVDQRFPVYDSGRGGRYTYHGPGQRVVYLMLDLKKRGPDVRNFVHAVEQWVIDALGDLGISARTADGRIGIWCDNANGQEAKIGAIGIRVRRWVTMHGLAVNIDPDLSHFGGIVPCGIADYPVTSMADLGMPAGMEEFDIAMKNCAENFLAGVGGDAANSVRPFKQKEKTA